jgi:hypothetical protein
MADSIRWTVRDREGNFIIVVIVLFSFDVNERGDTIQNNYVATAFFKHIRLKGE